jgi:GNAT superfamily N-acetyltransferase
VIGEQFTLERLGQHHDRASFLCAREPTLQTYLVDDARAVKDNNRNVSAVYVLLDTESNQKIAGYFTLSNCRVVPGTLPGNVARKRNAYPDWGATKLGRMARDESYHGSDVGTILVARAFQVALRVAELSGTVALIVDAKNDRLVSWYHDRGFMPLLDASRTLFIMNANMRAYLAAIELQIQAP